MNNNYICIHGHFYQPPRENPWLEQIEPQESARPFKNWNERISAECYYPNAYARILDAKGRTKKIVNNYESISFNFGPTLLSWLQKYDAATYEAILDADKKSCQKFNGHGNAIAQVYNHIIMPLAGERDKETQIIWGIRDFEHRFGRAPEGMWLAETACDTQTLMILAANGIKFTILAPGQCKKTRKIGDTAWTAEPNAKVDPKKPYLCHLPNGKSIVLFFYDGPISQNIAFGGTLASGENFARRLLSAFDKTAPGPQLVNIATDGETYGHHQRFGEMALAYCLDHVQKTKAAEIINYSAFLAKFPPQYEAVINENTSWSCSHGVQRWKADCGCNCAAQPGWHQKWRAPLRTALDAINAKMRTTFEDKGKEYFTNLRAARNAYIDVILDRSRTREFIAKYATPAGQADMPAALKLMQMQLNAMLMYTSCGWFFDELSGIETIQIMAYAKRAIGYNKALTGVELQDEFIKLLEAAPSNVPELANGANIYREFVIPMSTGGRKAAINYAAAYLTDEILFDDHIYSYHIQNPKAQTLLAGGAKLVVGRADFVSDITTESRTITFALLHNGGADIIGGASYEGTDLRPLKTAFAASDIEAAREQIKTTFTQVLTMGQLLKEKQKQILSNAIATAQARVEDGFKNIFHKEKSFLGYFKQASLPVPPLILNMAEFVLNSRLKQEILQDAPSGAQVAKITASLKEIGGKINEDLIKFIMTKRLEAMALAGEAQEIIDFMDAAKKYALPVDTYKAGNMVYRRVQAMSAEQQKDQRTLALCAALNLNPETEIS